VYGSQDLLCIDDALAHPADSVFIEGFHPAFDGFGPKLTKGRSLQNRVGKMGIVAEHFEEANAAPIPGIPAFFTAPPARELDFAG
jgi:hypothetical protein